MLDVGCWMLDVGCWMLDVGCWVLDVGCWVLDVGCSMFPRVHGEGEAFPVLRKNRTLNCKGPRTNPETALAFPSPSGRGVRVREKRCHWLDLSLSQARVDQRSCADAVLWHIPRDGTDRSGVDRGGVERRCHEL